MKDLVHQSVSALVDLGGRSLPRRAPGLGLDGGLGGLTGRCFGFVLIVQVLETALEALDLEALAFVSIGRLGQAFRQAAVFPARQQLARGGLVQSARVRPGRRSTPAGRVLGSPQRFRLPLELLGVLPLAACRPSPHGCGVVGTLLLTRTLEGAWGAF